MDAACGEDSLQVTSSFRTDSPVGEEEAHLYVERAEDRRIAADIRRGRYVTLLGARRTGKTSLLLKLRRELLGEGHVPVYVDLSLIGDANEDAWYRYLTGILDAGLNAETRAGGVGQIRDSVAFRQVLARVSRHLQPSRQVVFLLDELGALPLALLESALSTIRAMFNERKTSPEFRRYRFVMAGNFDPDDLVPESGISPFKVTSRIYTSDTGRDGVAEVVRHLERSGFLVCDEVVSAVYHWTGGDLYLTQRLCSLLERTQANSITRQLLARAVYDVISDEAVRDVIQRLHRWPEGRRAVRRILTGTAALNFNRASHIVSRLELIGVIRSDDAGYCAVRNEVYRKALLEWYGGLELRAGENRRGYGPLLPTKGAIGTGSPSGTQIGLASAMSSGTMVA